MLLHFTVLQLSLPFPGLPHNPVDDAWETLRHSQADLVSLS